MTDHANEAAPLCLIVPGLNGSGEGHWQTLWERSRRNMRRVKQDDWDDPRPERWVQALHQAIVEPDAPIILIAHSLGCHAVAWWAALIAQGYGRPVAAALLVAPPAIDRADAHPLLRRFAPMPRQPLPFPSILVASSNDEYASVEEAHRMARIWQSHLVNIGDRGHINAASGLGLWEEGQKLLDQLIAVATRRRIAQATTAGGLTAPLPVEISSPKQAWG